MINIVCSIKARFVKLFFILTILCSRLFLLISDYICFDFYLNEKLSFFVLDKNLKKIKVMKN